MSMPDRIPQFVGPSKSTTRSVPSHSHGAISSGVSENKQYPEIGVRVRAIREAFSGPPPDTRRVWAARHQFNESQYGNWETGVRRIPIECADLLCERYGLTLDFIYRGRMDGLSATARNQLSEHLPR